MQSSKMRKWVLMFYARKRIIMTIVSILVAIALLTSTALVLCFSDLGEGVIDFWNEIDFLKKPEPEHNQSLNQNSGTTSKPDQTQKETLPNTTTEPETSPETTQEDTTSSVDTPDSDNIINIGSAEQLISWANTIIENKTEYFEVTINFTDNIDLAGYNWTPIDGTYLDCVTFEGNGHTIYNMTIAGNDQIDSDDTHDYAYGIGFIQNAEYDLTFRNLTFDGANITAWERHVGVIIGNIYGQPYVTFDHVTVTNSRIDGWMDYHNQDFLNQEGHRVSFRIGGFIGAVFNGTYTFDHCSVINMQLDGFHNLAGFVGYDAMGRINASDFTNCLVSNVEMTFSYLLSDNYHIDMPKKYVSVFFNSYDWVDNIDEFEEYGNSYSGITYIDYTTGRSYTPDNFRSWTYEEAYP